MRKVNLSRYGDWKDIVLSQTYIRPIWPCNRHRLLLLRARLRCRDIQSNSRRGIQLLSQLLHWMLVCSFWIPLCVVLDRVAADSANQEQFRIVANPLLNPFNWMIVRCKCSSPIPLSFFALKVSHKNALAQWLETNKYFTWFHFLPLSCYVAYQYTCLERATFKTG